jgi:hypothetical protein
VWGMADSTGGGPRVRGVAREGERTRTRGAGGRDGEGRGDVTGRMGDVTEDETGAVRSLGWGGGRGVLSRARASARRTCRAGISGRQSAAAAVIPAAHAGGPVVPALLAERRGPGLRRGAAGMRPAAAAARPRVRVLGLRSRPRAGRPAARRCLELGARCGAHPADLAPLAQSKRLGERPVGKRDACRACARPPRMLGIASARVGLGSDGVADRRRAAAPAKASPLGTKLSRWGWNMSRNGNLADGSASDPDSIEKLFHSRNPISFVNSNTQDS